MRDGAVAVCRFEQLELDRGVCALVDGVQVALFRTSPDDEVHALSNYDPFAGAFVLSRGIVGSAGPVRKVASPMYKQSFDLRTGACLDDPAISLPTFPVEVIDGVVHVDVTRRA